MAFIYIWWFKMRKRNSHWLFVRILVTLLLTRSALQLQAHPIGTAMPTSISLIVTINGSDVHCFGGSTGSPVATASGGTAPYAYLWSNGQSLANASNLAAGSYTVTVTDNVGSTATASVTINQPALLAAAPTNSGNVCSGTGTATVLSNASGGTPSYTYLWTPGNLTTANLTNVGAGTYNLTVTDAYGCTASGSTPVGSFTPLPANFSVNQ